MYTGKITIGGKEINDFNIRDYRRSDVHYKKRYIEAIAHLSAEDVEKFLEDLTKVELSKKQAAEQIVDAFFFYDIITLVDFINPYPITYKIAKAFIEHDLLIKNIKFTDSDDKVYSNWKSFLSEYSKFDWELALENNYKFIIWLE